jgi:hypothetical protein
MIEMYDVNEIIKEIQLDVKYFNENVNSKFIENMDKNLKKMRECCK